jgi:hypothetical protein
MMSSGVFFVMLSLAGFLVYRNYEITCLKPEPKTTLVSFNSSDDIYAADNRTPAANALRISAYQFGLYLTGASDIDNVWTYIYNLMTSEGYQSVELELNNLPSTDWLGRIPVYVINITIPSVPFIELSEHILNSINIPHPPISIFELKDFPSSFESSVLLNGIIEKYHINKVRFTPIEGDISDEFSSILGLKNLEIPVKEITLSITDLLNTFSSEILQSLGRVSVVNIVLEETRYLTLPYLADISLFDFIFKCILQINRNTAINIDLATQVQTDSQFNGILQSLSLLRIRNLKNYKVTMRLQNFIQFSLIRGCYTWNADISLLALIDADNPPFYGDEKERNAVYNFLEGFKEVTITVVFTREENLLKMIQFLISLDNLDTLVIKPRNESIKLTFEMKKRIAQVNRQYPAVRIWPNMRLL